MSPSISVRESIRWPPQNAHELTRTLVLTSAENRFVDIRIFRPHPQSGIDEGREDVLPDDRLDWAFAGTSASARVTAPDGREIMHSTWRHWVDSRHRDTAQVSDEGDMFPIHDGRTLEKGSMVNPATGRVAEYEEVWLDVEPEATGQVSRQAGDGGGSEGDVERKRMCVVLELQDDERKARGMIVRVGQFCQGVLRVGSHFALEKWQWDGEWGWRRAVRMGDLLVPCGPCTNDHLVIGGARVSFGEFSWEVVESGEF